MREKLHPVRGAFQWARVVVGNVRQGLILMRDVPVWVCFEVLGEVHAAYWLVHAAFVPTWVAQRLQVHLS